MNPKLNDDQSQNNNFVVETPVIDSIIPNEEVKKNSDVSSAINQAMTLEQNHKEKNKNITHEVINGESVKVINEVRSAYQEPVKPKVETDPAKIQALKEADAQKRQTEYNKLIEKIKIEEAKKLQEQDKIIAEREKQEKIKKEKEAIIKQKELKELEEHEKEMLEQKKSGVKKKSFFERINTPIGGGNKKLSPKQEMELKVRSDVLSAQFKDKDASTTRLEKPLIFNYYARNADGQLEKSSIEALSRMDVYSFLLAEGYTVYEITASKSNNSLNLTSFRFKRSRLIFYLSQLSAYLKSGIALADAVKILVDQSSKVNEKKTWKAVYYDLSMGDILSTALEKRGEAFPKLLTNMIKTAEMTGNLPETLDDMVDYYTESESTKKQMKSAMMYPTIVTVFAAVVVIFILMWIVPQFSGMYSELGSAEMPGITVFLINLSEFLGNNILLIVAIILGLVLVFYFLFKKIKSFRKAVQTMLMHLPVFGNIIIYNEVTIFTKTFANLINHNVFITDSMDVLSKITENEIYKGLIYNAARNLVKGDTLSKAFKDNWAFPNIAYQMLITGEKTGRLGPMMEKVSEYYQEQHRTIINQMKSLIEPILIVGLAVVVGGILLAVLMPMYGIYDQL